MKKLIIAMAAMMMAFASLAAAETTSDKYVTKDYDLKDFTGIVASGIYDIQLQKSNTWKVSVSVPEALEEYLDIRVTNGKLVLAMKQVPVKISKNYTHWTLTAKVAMPVLKSLNMSGATKFSCDDTFDIGNGSFKMEISGASKVNGLNIKGRDLDMEMSGATSGSIKGSFDTADIEMSGAAKCNFDIDAEELDQEVNGAAKAYHNGNFNSIKLEASGAGVFSYKNAAESMTFEASGAAKVETSKAMIKNVRASISGASYCEVNALSNLIVEATGASSLRYVDNEDMDLNIRSISRGASVAKMK